MPPPATGRSNSRRRCDGAVKVAVLTTESAHHAFFVRELAADADIVAFCESTSGSPPPFETRHPFEDDRDSYEWGRWFGGVSTKIEALARVHDVESMNDAASISALVKEKPDLVIVFGTGVLRAALIDECRDRIFNLHGGDPEEYRGLDTHLWAIFHRDFAALVTTLHRLDYGLDTGSIVYRESVPIVPQMPLYALRAANTELCLQLARRAIATFAKGTTIPSRAQKRKGRYYSAMPAVLKAVCKERFDRYVSGLKDGA